MMLGRPFRRRCQPALARGMSEGLVLGRADVGMPAGSGKSAGMSAGMSVGMSAGKGPGICSAGTVLPILDLRSTG